VDLTGERSGSINRGPEGLSLISYTGGPRFTYPVHRHYAPFAQALFGGVHGFDSSFPVASRIPPGANSFAMLAGGGLDIRLQSHLAVRPIQADYFLTHLSNGLNNRQNSLRLSAGVVLHFW
jgi:outer membrane immunogenic protein